MVEYYAGWLLRDVQSTWPKTRASHSKSVHHVSSAAEGNLYLYVCGCEVKGLSSVKEHHHVELFSADYYEIFF